MGSQETPHAGRHPDDVLTIDDFRRIPQNLNPLDNFAKVFEENGGANTTLGIDDGALELGFTPAEIQARRRAIEIARQQVIDEANKLAL